MKYVVRLDWATLNFDKGAADRENVSRLIAGDMDLKWKQKGSSENAPWISPLGLRWSDNSGWESTPHKLEVSGVGCEHFAPTLATVRDRELSHFSRLDFAFDAILSRSEWRDFIKKAFCASMDSERERKSYRLSGEGEAMTVYIGSRKSAKFFRIYNKTQQDPRYTFLDPETGKPVDLRDDQCVIRYEVELKRHKVVSTKGGIRLFDPSPCFDAYYSSKGERVNWLFSELKKLWHSFGDEVLLPADFDNAEFIRRIDLIEQNKKTVQIDRLEDNQKLEIVKEALHDFPHTFDRTLEYIVAKFGKYIPYIMSDNIYARVCYDSCESAFGFAPDSCVIAPPVAWGDLVGIDEDIPISFTGFGDSGEQLSLDDID